MEIVHKKEFESSRLSVEGRSAQKGVHHSALESPNDFLKQIEPLDPSGFAKFCMETLVLFERRVRSSKGRIDTITFEGIATDFFKRGIDIYNRVTEKPRQYRLEMENEDDS